MSIHIIIDGYNLIRQSDTLSIIDRQDLTLGRDVLIETLAAYKKLKPHRITVVFDGSLNPAFSQDQNEKKGIGIKYSHGGESADEVIKRMARKEKEKALVVSSDLDIVNSVASYGAATISAPMFEDKIQITVRKDCMQNDEDDPQGWIPTTKKKGPPRRLSKRQRRNRKKIRKL